MNCPCGSGKEYAECCGRYVEGTQWAPSPEALMRSRYTAYTRQNFHYIQKTMKGEALAAFNLIQAKKIAKETKWLKLQVLSANENEIEGTVEFIAFFQFQEHDQMLHEISRFQKIQGQWYYVSGTVS